VNKINFCFSRLWILSLVFLLVLSWLSFGGKVALAEKPSNIILIITDDHRFDDIDGVMPKTQKLIFEKGVSFEKAYITNPACCPSRSSIFTGKYSSEHKVIGNRYILKEKTIFDNLSQQYYLGFVGKYLNTHSGKPINIFDYWVSHRGGSTVYNNPVLYVNSETKRRVSGYVTDLFRDYSLEFIEKAKVQEKPFFLTLSFNAPHSPVMPHPDDLNSVSLEDLPVAKYPSFALSSWEKKKLRKPKIVTDIELSKEEEGRVLSFAKKQRECLASVDRAIESILNALDAANLTKDTLIIFLSDNGLMNGEQGMTEKDVVYESAIHVPFAIRYDKLVNTGHIDKNSLVANIDIAPTIMELAGVKEFSSSGQSLVPLLSESDPNFRKSLLIESFRKKIGDKQGNDLRQPFAAVHTGRFVYVRNFRSISEFYDLERDKYQIKNLVLNKEYSATIRRLKRELSVLLKKHRGSNSWEINDTKQIMNRSKLHDY